MNLAPDRYYRHAGAIPFGGNVLVIGAGVAAAAGMSLLYALLCFYNPFVYLTFIGAGLFGAGVGWAVAAGAKAGKVRNRFFSSVVALAAGLLALYFCWVWYLFVGSHFQILVFEPQGILFFMQLLGQFGAWEIFGWTPIGWGLYSFWMIEALMVVGAAVAVALASNLPFCESCNCWTQERKDVALLGNADGEALIRDLEAERYGRLDELRAAEFDSANCLHLHLATCPECTGSNYLSLQHVLVTPDGKGDVKTTSTDVIQNLIVPHWLVEKLAAAVETDEPPPEPLDAQQHARESMPVDGPSKSAG